MFELGSSVSHPDGRDKLKDLLSLVEGNVPFSFVRFSDGEVEVLRNRRLKIGAGLTEFRGRVLNNSFPVFDDKEFDPKSGQELRRDLLASACYRDECFYKGIPTAHNNAVVDREFLLRLNGGLTPQMTYSDLFLNSNYVEARKTFFPRLVANFDVTVVIGNWRCQPNGLLRDALLVEIQDNFFANYTETYNKTMESLICIPSNSLVLSSASSLTNIVGHRLRLQRPDLTFIDVGTSLNDMLGLQVATRAYHKLIDPKGIRQKLAAAKYRCSSEYRLRW